jgi:hypothetical protein
MAERFSFRLPLVISTNRRDFAEAAAKGFGVAATFDNHLDLIADPGVDNSHR